MKNQTKTLGVWICLVFFMGAGAQAMSCEPPALFNTAASKEEADQAFAATLFDQLQSDDPTQFIVYGKFERSDERPLIHIIEHAERWRRNNWKETETNAGIEYTYRNVFQFSGVRIFEGKEVKFTTAETIISVSIDGTYIHGQTPPTGRLVVGRMWEPDPVYYRINNSPCDGYAEISDQQYKALLECASSSGCNQQP